MINILLISNLLINKGHLYITLLADGCISGLYFCVGRQSISAEYALYAPFHLYALFSPGTFPIYGS